MAPARYIDVAKLHRECEPDSIHNPLQFQAILYNIAKDYSRLSFCFCIEDTYYKVLYLKPVAWT